MTPEEIAEIGRQLRRTPTGYMRVYTRKYGRKAHLIREPDWSYPYPTSVCGIQGSSMWWRGTGSQREYERAAELHTCTRCLRRAEES